MRVHVGTFRTVQAIPSGGGLVVPVTGRRARRVRPPRGWQSYGTLHGYPFLLPTA